MTLALCHVPRRATAFVAAHAEFVPGGIALSNFDSVGEDCGKADRQPANEEITVKMRPCQTAVFTGSLNDLAPLALHDDQLR